MSITGRPLALFCSWRGHRRAAEKSWDGEFYHSRCARCGAAILRLSGERHWRLPDVDELRYFEKKRQAAATLAAPAQK